MKYIVLAFFTVLIFSCENHAFDRDKRQIVAKDEIRRRLLRVSNFDITGFKEDTLKEYLDTSFNGAIRYMLNVRYNDSTGAQVNKTGYVIFTPDGKSVINTQITDIQQ